MLLKNSIKRSIEFSPEHHQAGVSILNYFATVLRKKYPYSKATVQIKQDGLKVTMIIDPVDGDSEVIEKTLDDYGLVVRGETTSEELFPNDPFEVMALKNKLEIAEMELRQTQRLHVTVDQVQHSRLQDHEDQIRWLRDMVGDSLRGKNTTQSA
ncbi:MAG: hypothetical protein GY757_53105 [bacterium]|nr:hypothetical protein [bacterium]